MRKLRRADELAAADKTNDEIAADLEVSTATLYNWRCSYGGMDVDAAKELRELLEQNSRLKRLLADAELREGRSARGGEGKVLSPDAKRRGVDMLEDVLSMSERLACKAVGLLVPPTVVSRSPRFPPTRTPTCGNG